MKTLFLDLDGVLLRPGGPGEDEWVRNDSACLLLRKVLDESSGKIALSSGRRFNPADLETALKMIPEIRALDMHPHQLDRNLDRRISIAEWLNRHPHTHEFAIIDDQGVLFDGTHDYIRNRLVLCCGQTGLSSRGARRTLRLLGCNPDNIPLEGLLEEGDDSKL